MNQNYGSNGNGMTYVPVDQYGDPMQNNPMPNQNFQNQQNQAPQEQVKRVQITNINSRVVRYTDRRTGQQKEFTVYDIYCNDGIKYETSAKWWIDQRNIGETLALKYVVESKAANNGQVYTHYKIVTPSLADRISALEERVFGKANIPETRNNAPAMNAAPAISPSVTGGSNGEPYPVQTFPNNSNQNVNNGFGNEEVVYDDPNNPIGPGDEAPEELPF